MSIRATNLVRGLRGLSPSEKAVAFVLADHDDHRGGRGSFPSMSTVAEEAGLQDRETASRITKRLADFGIILTDNPSRGRKPTVYRFNFGVFNRDFRVTVENQPTMIRASRLASSNRDSSPPPTVTQNDDNRDSQITGRVLEGKKEGGMAHAVISGSAERHTAGASTSSRSQVETAIAKTARSIDPSAAIDGGQQAHLEAGIHRKTIAAAYFDATRAKMKPDDCVRAAIYAGALSLVGNRSVELRGLDHEGLARNSWERIRNSISALHEMRNFDQQSKQVVAVVTRCLTASAMKFWERARAEANASAHRSERGEHHAAGAA